jgi:hypothetical protein
MPESNETTPPGNVGPEGPSGMDNLTRLTHVLNTVRRPMDEGFIFTLAGVDTSKLTTDELDEIHTLMQGYAQQDENGQVRYFGGGQGTPEGEDIITNMGAKLFTPKPK